jgi:hypothetical protein
VLDRGSDKTPDFMRALEKKHGKAINHAHVENDWSNTAENGFG